MCTVTSLCQCLLGAPLSLEAASTQSRRILGSIFVDLLALFSLLDYEIYYKYIYIYNIPLHELSETLLHAVLPTVAIFWSWLQGRFPHVKTCGLEGCRTACLGTSQLEVGTACLGNS